MQIDIYTFFVFAFYYFEFKYFLDFFLIVCVHSFELRVYVCVSVFLFVLF